MSIYTEDLSECMIAVNKYESKIIPAYEKPLQTPNARCIWNIKCAIFKIYGHCVCSHPKSTLILAKGDNMFQNDEQILVLII